MNLPLRITFEGIDYTYTILTKIIGRETSEIRISLNGHEMILAKDERGEWCTAEETFNDHADLLKSIARNIALRYRL